VTDWANVVDWSGFGWMLGAFLGVLFAASVINYTPLLWRKYVNIRVSLQESRARGYWTCWKLVIGFIPDRAAVALALEDLKLWADYTDMAPKHKSHWEDWDKMRLAAQYRVLEQANRKGMPYGGHRAGFITRLDDMEKSLGDCPWHGPNVVRNRRREAVAATKAKQGCDDDCHFGD